MNENLPFHITFTNKLRDVQWVVHSLVIFSDTYKVKLENNIEMPIKPKFYRGDMLMLCLTEEKLTRMTFFSKD